MRRNLFLLRKLSILLFSLLTILVLAACNSKIDKNQGSDEDDIVIEPVLVDLKLPETADPGEEIVMTARVTQGEEVVSDASEVVFELRNDVTGEKEMIDAVWDGTEFYTLRHTFQDAGIFSVTSHVTARNMHTMPTKKIVVGTIDEEATTDGHHHHHGAEISFDSGNAVAGEPTVLKSEVVVNGEKLTEGRIRFELWVDGSEKHDWLYAEETEAGVYEATHEFTEKGSYFVQVHVEKGKDLHEHTTIEFTVE